MLFEMPLLRKFQDPSQQAEPKDLSHSTNHKYRLETALK